MLFFLLTDLKEFHLPCFEISLLQFCNHFVLECPLYSFLLSYLLHTLPQLSWKNFAVKNFCVISMVLSDGGKGEWLQVCLICRALPVCSLKSCRQSYLLWMRVKRISGLGLPALQTVSEPAAHLPLCQSFLRHSAFCGCKERFKITTILAKWKGDALCWRAVDTVTSSHSLYFTNFPLFFLSHKAD